jgi:hypothetical protein
VTAMCEDFRLLGSGNAMVHDPNGALTPRSRSYSS